MQPMKLKSYLYQLKQLGRVKRSMSREDLKILLHAFISTRMDYCNSLLGGQPISLINRFLTVRLLHHVCMQACLEVPLLFLYCVIIYTVSRYSTVSIL